MVRSRPRPRPAMACPAEFSPDSVAGRQAGWGRKGGGVMGRGGREGGQSIYYDRPRAPILDDGLVSGSGAPRIVVVIAAKART